MEKQYTGKLIAAIVMILIAVSLVTVLADQSNLVTKKTTQTETVNIAAAKLAAGAINETYGFTLNTGSANWRNDYGDCIAQVLVVKNASGSVFADPANYTYVYNLASKQLKFKNAAPLNATSASNVTVVSYDYCPDGYMAQSFGRMALEIAVGLFALAIFLIGVWFMYEVFRDLNA